jgi:hypothetical protein
MDQNKMYMTDGNNNWWLVNMKESDPGLTCIGGECTIKPQKNVIQPLTTKSSVLAFKPDATPSVLVLNTNGVRVGFVMALLLVFASGLWFGVVISKGNRR